MSGSLPDTRAGVPPNFESVIRLWPRSASCADARHAVRAFCCDHAMSHLADDAELLTSELVTNAIRHAGTMITLVMMCDNTEFTVSVRDDNRDEPALTVADLTAEGGRGLRLVDAISGDWGITRHTDAKSVWFRLPRERVTLRSARLDLSGPCAPSPPLSQPG